MHLKGLPSILVSVFNSIPIPMKQNLRKGLMILLSAFLCTTACKKSVDPVASTPGADHNPYHDTTQSASVVPYPITPVAECNTAPDYGDSIVYPQPNSGSDFYIYPQSNKGIAGSYMAWPLGLAIDPKTGNINLTKSETGMRYSVGFVKSGTHDTCLSELIVGGAAYKDSVYVLSENKDVAKPYFDAQSSGPSVCEDPGPGCKFDYNNYAKMQGIEIDHKTGNIDLDKTMKHFKFGLFPFNGTTVYTTIWYMLPDKTNNAPQSIQLKMVYYTRKSDIPAATLAAIADNSANTTNDILISKGPSIRPPLIVIVRYN